MQFTLLVIDDELESPVHAGATARRQYYDRLKEHFEIVFLPDPGDLHAELSRRVVHGILLDFVLEGWKTDAASILAQLPRDIPVGLISGHWGPNFERLRATLAAYKEQVAQLFTWEDLENEERRSLVVTWMKFSISSARNIATTKIGPNDAVRILQLSDIQFEAEPPPRFKVETELLAQRLHDACGASPDFMALTGDIAQHGLPSEYRNAEQWLRSLSKELDADWSGDRFLVVPGNHDICWALGRSARIRTDTDTLSATGDGLYSELRGFALEPFRAFTQSLCGTNVWGDKSHHWVEGRYRHLGLVFCGLNTCEDLKIDSEPTRRILDATVADLFKTIRVVSKDAGDPLLVGLMHHPLFSPPSEEGVVNPDDFLGPLASFSKAYVNLCGHVHTDICNLTSRNSAKVLEIVAPTPTRLEKDRPPDSTRGFNLIEFARQDARVIGLQVTTYKFERHRLIAGEQSKYLRDAKGKLSEAS